MIVETINQAATRVSTVLKSQTKETSLTFSSRRLPTQVPRSTIGTITAKSGR